LRKRDFTNIKTYGSSATNFCKRDFTIIKTYGYSPGLTYSPTHFDNPSSL